MSLYFNYLAFACNLQTNRKKVNNIKYEGLVGPQCQYGYCYSDEDVWNARIDNKLHYNILVCFSNF